MKITTQKQLRRQFWGWFLGRPVKPGSPLIEEARARLTPPGWLAPEGWQWAGGPTDEKDNEHDIRANRHDGSTG